MKFRGWMCAALALSGAACRDGTAPSEEWIPTGFGYVIVPERVVPGTPFSVIGAAESTECLQLRHLVQRRGAELVVAAEAARPTQPGAIVCSIGRSTVPLTIEITPPYPLPFTVRFRQPNGADILRTVTAAPSA